jgi:hypothetical protein
MDKWYKRNVGIIALLILFFPVGLYLMWKYARWSQAAKWSVTGVIIVCGIASQINRVSTSSSTIAVQPPTSARDTLTASTSTPVPVTAWRTTHTYSGSGIKKTEIIPLSNDWKLQWTCDPASERRNKMEPFVSIFLFIQNTMSLVANNDFEVIGNIWQTPELLTERTSYESD